MNFVYVTKVLILVSLFIWIVYDGYVYWQHGIGSTISVVIISWAYYMPGIPFALGILMGHLVFGLPTPKNFPEGKPE